MVIIGEDRDRASMWADLAMELGLYAQAAGVSVLHISHRQPERLDTRAFDLLAGVSALRAQGIERAVVVSHAHQDDPTAPAPKANAIIPGFIQSVLNVSRSASEVGEHLTELVEAVSAAVETICGTATTLILTGPAPKRVPARIVMRQRQLDFAMHSARLERPASGGSPSTVTHPELIVRVSETMTPAERARVLESLYGWSMARLGLGAVGARATAGAHRRLRPSVPDAPRAGAEEVRAAVQEARAWLDDQWLDILAGMRSRHPKWKPTPPGSVAAVSGMTGVSFLQARRSWRFLDVQARHEWMNACAEIIRLMATLARPEPVEDGLPAAQAAFTTA
jgi:hypothetical protein